MREPVGAEEVVLNPVWEPGKMLFEVTGAEGDTKTIWDKSNPDEVEAAEKQFNFLTKEKKYKAYYVTGEKGERGGEMKKFDKDAERIVFNKPNVGG